MPALAMIITVSSEEEESGSNGTSDVTNRAAIWASAAIQNLAAS